LKFLVLEKHKRQWFEIKKYENFGLHLSNKDKDQKEFDCYPG